MSTTLPEAHSFGPKLRPTAAITKYYEATAWYKGIPEGTIYRSSGRQYDKLSKNGSPLYIYIY
ncbi:hypothetical protein N7499_008366 [Penicillium canescens]|uniref:Uncharacterized protein n=1 Tax=Penicillium canescens TaxID=5083 RepID=A0AAD6N266_PENCN|nr:uncharacterized protein N7446_013400 [Penicillium canescens]KAJ5985355.1 hypothetical protein N7522_012551 [Penicillium canescens]KAJ6023048.1 hypothetical protein N7460_013443 [Penicillium canescens]KAJ6025688.1 hypothetical protein N7444_013367 [Penicillium canescens]KAJ6042334.1 hypothetical protein N7446_013400 [Penicillium canescens]KAJ6076385.1 hypothetical protein N7499_008366 [Penicillium canescens]